MENELVEIRNNIDRIDADLLALFIERMQCSEQVAKIKRNAGLPIQNATREQEILQRVSKRAGEYGFAATALYTTIMAVSRAHQHILLDSTPEFSDLARTGEKKFLQSHARIICQGVEGAYSHRAARQVFTDSTVLFRPSFEAVFLALEQEVGDYGILPVENSAAGSVSEVYGLLLKYRYYIVGAVSVSVDHLLAARNRQKTTRVISHPQALLQCTEYIRTHSLEQTAFSNTAAAAKYVAESETEGIAAICSREAAEKYGLTILAERIQDDQNNRTRFVVVSKNPLFTQNANKISLCFSLPNATGSLYRVLERFALSGLNLTKIESRPIRGSNFQYDFYLDFNGNIKEENVMQLISTLKDELPHFSFLGNYREM